MNARNSSFEWTPGQGPDAVSLARMAQAFPMPKNAMGEAWFMSPERKMFPELRSDLDTLSDDYLESACQEIAVGPSSFGHEREWTDWYHYLLPRLIERRWAWSVYHPAEILITAFMSQHSCAAEMPGYRAFRYDAVQTLGRYIMTPRFWPNGEIDVRNCLQKWQSPSGVWGWYRAGGLFSASLFFCTKYLQSEAVPDWFRSVVAIPDLHWKAQLITWLVGAYPILVGDISQPAEFPEGDTFDVAWSWSHTLSGNYSGNFEEPIYRTLFLPIVNRESVLDVARIMRTEDFFDRLAKDPKLEAVAAETAGLKEKFLDLYRG